MLEKKATPSAHGDKQESIYGQGQDYFQEVITLLLRNKKMTKVPKISATHKSITISGQINFNLLRKYHAHVQEPNFIASWYHYLPPKVFYFNLFRRKKSATQNQGYFSVHSASGWCVHCDKESEDQKKMVFIFLIQACFKKLENGDKIGCFPSRRNSRHSSLLYSR